VRRFQQSLALVCLSLGLAGSGSAISLVAFFPFKWFCS